MTPDDLIAEARREDEQATEELLTVKQYARLYGVHIQTIYTAIRYGRLPYPTERVTTGKKASIRIRVPRGSIKTLKYA